MSAGAVPLTGDDELALAAAHAIIGNRAASDSGQRWRHTQRSVDYSQIMMQRASAVWNQSTVSNLEFLSRLSPIPRWSEAGQKSHTVSKSLDGRSTTQLALAAAAPDLRCAVGSARSFVVPGGFAGPAAQLMVQRSASSATFGRAVNRAMRRSASMHRRMQQLVVQAKMMTETSSDKQELVGVRGPGQVVGDTSFGSRAVPATATVRARSRMKVLLVRRQDAAALKQQPGVKAALLRTQTESSVLDVLESFVSYDSEVAAIDELRKSLAAASQSFSAAQNSNSVGSSPIS
eukprot:gene6820-7037_t